MSQYYISIIEKDDENGTIAYDVIGGCLNSTTLNLSLSASGLQGAVKYQDSNTATITADANGIQVNIVTSWFVMQSLADAKGDLIVGSGDNAFSKLSVGTNGYVLTADSTQPFGVKWALIPSLPAGSTNNTLRHNGVSWATNTTIQNDDNGLLINTNGTRPSGGWSIVGYPKNSDYPSGAFFKTYGGTTTGIAVFGQCSGENDTAIEGYGRGTLGWFVNEAFQLTSNHATASFTISRSVPTLNSFDFTGPLLDLVNHANASGVILRGKKGDTVVYVIDKDGLIQSAPLAGTGNRDVYADASGNIKAYSGKKKYMLSGQTANSNSTEIFVNGVANARMVIPTGKAWQVRGTVIAKATTGTNTAGWDAYGLKCMVNNTGDTVTIQPTSADAIPDYSFGNGVNWRVNLDADDTNNSLKVSVTGDSSLTVNWQIEIEIVEV